MSYEPKRYKIIGVKSFTPDVRLFRVKCKLDPKPGQFLEVSVSGFGECPLASCSHMPEFVDLLTRRAGNVTNAMFNLKEGDSIFIRGPYGKGFPVEKLKGKNLILVAGGTGIAPVTSFINFVEQNRKSFGKVFIYFGFRDEKNILLKDRIERWSKKFNVHICLNECEKHSYEKGFVNDVMDKHKPEVENTVALLCGPEAMMDAVTKELKKLGVTHKNVYWSMERRMECGFGSCGRCQIQDVYVCKDGPVFRYDFIKSRLDNERSSERWSE